MQRIEEADAKRAAQKKRKNKKNSSKSASKSSEGVDEVTCDGCGQLYTEDEAESWIGCDGCEAWYHYFCAGLSSMRM